MFKRDQLELCMKITRPKRPRFDGKKMRKEQHADESVASVFEEPMRASMSSKESNASFQAPNTNVPSLPAAYPPQTSSTQNYSWNVRGDTPSAKVSMMEDIEPRPMRGSNLKLQQMPAGQSFQSKPDGLSKYHQVSSYNCNKGFDRSSGLMSPSDYVNLGQGRHHDHRDSNHGSTSETNWMLNAAMNFKIWDSLDKVGDNSDTGSQNYSSDSNQGQQQRQQPEFLHCNQEQGDDDDDLCSQVSLLEYSEECDDTQSYNHGMELSFAIGPYLPNEGITRV